MTVRTPQAAGRKVFRLVRVLLLAPILVLHLGACGPEGGADPRGEPLLVLGASDLLAAFEELIPLYESRTGQRVHLVLGSTGNLAAQIRNGAPADLFFSANEGFLDDLIAGGWIDAPSRRIYAVGRLALVVPGGTPLPDAPMELDDPRFRTFAIANPDHAPYGSAAREVLRSLDLWRSLESSLVLGENVAHALQFVSTGNADGGLVALSLVAGGAGEGLPFLVIDAELHPPLLQVAGLVTGSARSEEAGALLDFVLSEAGQSLLARYGFDPPPVD